LAVLCRQAGAIELRACYPSDLIDILEWIADFEERAVQMTREDLRRAVEIYFTHE
jgi:plasmid stabilization system protein ParE